MTQHAIRTGNGFLTYSEVDHTFIFEGEKVEMEFHHYCGPMFMIVRETHGERSEEELCPDDSERFKPLWEEFSRWQESPKGIEVQELADKRMGVVRDENGIIKDGVVKLS